MSRTSALAVVVVAERGEQPATSELAAVAVVVVLEPRPRSLLAPSEQLKALPLEGVGQAGLVVQRRMAALESLAVIPHSDRF